MEICIALGGNPNSGKSTLFNELTGSKQHVANYPGVTVDRKEGLYIDRNVTIRVIDLPGTYSLTAYSAEEMVARNFLIDEKPDVIVNVVDASSIERNLYLTIQFLELGIPICIALNMIDAAKNAGIVINVEKLSKIIGIPIIPIIARTGFGKKNLIETIKKIINTSQKEPLRISYGADIENAISEIEKIITTNKFRVEKYNSRWLSIKYLENDEEIITTGISIDPLISKKIVSISKKVSVHIKETLETYPEAIIVDQRYGYINSIVRQDIIHERFGDYKSSMSDRIDKVLVNRLAGPIIMLFILAGLYHFTFTYSNIPIGWCNSFFIFLGDVAKNNINNEILKSLVVSGIINGVGGVMSFVPLIFFMFLGISIIEDSGYLARIAFMMDRIFQIFGLHGNSVMPFIISGGIAGGCAVPGVMATRTLKSPKERIATLLTLPFMSCGAKLPILIMLITIFFDNKNTEVMLLLTIISWIIALLTAKFLRTTVITGEATPFVMELPPYRLPTFKGLLVHACERTWQYIKKAGTVILGISVILWFLMTFPRHNPNQEELERYENNYKFTITNNSSDKEYSAENGWNICDTKDVSSSKLSSKQSEELLNSAAGKIGKKLEKITKWAGFDWRTNIALLGGFAAKEVIISTLGTTYSLENYNYETKKSLEEILKSDPEWSPLSALSLIAFIMLYSPCSATIVCIVKETSIKWGIFSIFFNTLLAFCISILIYQTGLWLGY